MTLEDNHRVNSRLPIFDIVQGILLDHMTQMLALEFDCRVEKHYYRRKASLAVGVTRT